MEFIQKKTIDRAVERFLTKAAESEISLAWDRYEGQLPECGFCETGLSCRDCLQGPCISHPFRDSNKAGVCGKDKDILAIQSLLRLALKGTMVYLDQLSDLVKGVESGEIKPKNKTKSAQILKEVRSLLGNGGLQAGNELPKPLIRRWGETGIVPEGIARDLFKASQKLEGGMADVEETLLWAFKSSLLACMAHRLQGNLKKSAWGDPVPTKVEVGLGVLRKETPNLLLYGYVSPILKRKIAEEAKKNGVHVAGVCTDPLIPPFSFSQATNYGSQEIPLMTGAVDLIVAGDQSVNPSLARIAKEWEVPIVSAEVLKKEKHPGPFARQIVERTKKSFDFRQHFPREIPETREYAMMGFSREQIDAKKVASALNSGQLKGIAILSGSNNVKYTQDQEIVTLAQEFLKNDILCISRGEASVTLAKYGLLNPAGKEGNCGKALADFLSSSGTGIPSILDFGEGGPVDFLFDLARTGKKELETYPIVACFPEANRSSEVTEALWTVAMGIPTYFWPSLPVTGSQKAMEALTTFCCEKFGAKLNVITEKKIDARTKANLILKALRGEEGPGLGGKSWK
jgi:anaerobic carbon-monoxide dehydrogenase catalytic subunit